MKRFINVFLCSFLLIGSVMPLRVFADSGTYVLLENNINFDCGGGWSVTATGSGDIRLLGLYKTGSVSGYTIWVLSDSAFSRVIFQNGESKSTQNGSYKSTLGGYYAVNYNINSSFINSMTIPSFESDARTNSDNAFYYAFGEGSVSPVPPEPTYTRPANVQYNTRISGSGAAAANNIDRITWDSAVDTNGTELPQNARVQVRAIPGQYTGTTKQDLLTKTYTDFVIDNTKAVQLVDIIASRGVYETKWSEVTAHFNLPFATFYSLIEGDSYWYRNGWIYQIRLQVDDYFSDWVNIYTATGSGVEESETITNSDTLTQKLVQQIQIINNLNETATNWYISETEINMQPYEEPSEGEKPWWAYLLEAITNLVDSVVKGITNIISSLADLAGDIIDGILGLFSFDSFEVEDWSTQQQQIKDNSGMFGQALDFTQSLQQTFEGVEYQEPILHFDGIELDNITVIPEQTYNLNDYVESLGLTNFRNIAYLCTDGFIYFSLVLLIIRKLEGIFKK